MSARFDRRFAGRSNAGLRAEIRRVADGVMPACGPVVERAVLALSCRIALTALGRATLADVAADYRAANGDYCARCDCDACCAGNLQRLGALG